METIKIAIEERTQYVADKYDMESEEFVKFCVKKVEDTYFSEKKKYMKTLRR